jgi:uncharacterized sodium:solute symporter family permease YidK
MAVLLMFKLILPDVPLWQIVSVLALSAGIYTMAGGLRAVMVTETVQALVLLLAAVLISVFAFDKAGGWDAVMQAVDPAKLSLIRPANDPGVPWTGLLFGVPLLGFYFWCTQPVHGATHSVGAQSQSWPLGQSVCRSAQVTRALADGAAGHLRCVAVSNNSAVRIWSIRPCCSICCQPAWSASW